MANVSHASEKLSIAEALSVFAIVMAYIWKLRAPYPHFWLVPVAVILASHLARHERPPELGFRTKNFGVCFRKYGLAVIGLALTMWICGLAFGTIRPLGFWQAVLSLAIYVPWGLFQQYLMNGYFLRRFEVGLSRHAAEILTAALFCVVHVPNWFLMAVTLPGAFAAMWVYRRYRNLYVLGLAHATLGFVLFMAVPDSISHHLRVGPGWFSWR
jgi:membrane protease YdiL (CAAX protease family)